MATEMRSLILSSVLVLALTSIVSAQSDTITIKKNGIVTVLQVDGKSLSFNELSSVLGKNDQANQVYKKAKANYYVAMLFGITGGALIGYPLGYALGSGDFLVAPFVTGVGLTSISAVFFIRYTNRTMKAVGIYNAAVEANSRVD